MRVILNKVGKQFDQHWVIRDVNGEFAAPEAVAVLGQNGSGKSTLIKMLSGYVHPDDGTVEFIDSTKIPPDEIYLRVSMAAPWMELIEEFTLTETLKFHGSFRSWIKPFTIKQLLEISELTHASHKQIRHFSSGMKQRVKLLLAILTQSNLLLLDEPCSNLDAKAVAWYQQLLREYQGERLLFVASNHQAEEIFCCTNQIELATH
ncbi:MAG: ABC transporter ATP-binding protein [Flavobacteriales bacterium]|nr:ABC transporter ATP-binding protein [Flavobacteriales bacterium]